MSQLTIKGQQFEIADDPSVVEGAIMTAAHAHSLQQTRRENIRNNFAANVEKAVDADGALPELAKAELQQKLTEYAAAYQFGVRGTGTGRVVRDPVEKEMLRLAKDDIAAAYKAKTGETVKGEALTEAAEKLLSVKGDEYNRRARRAIRDRDAAAQAVLADMAA